MSVLTSSSRIYASVNRSRIRRVRGNGKIAWEPLRNRCHEEFAVLPRDQKSDKREERKAGEGGEGNRERGDRSGRVGGRRSPVSPIETSPVHERKRQAPIANGTDGTNARVASLFLPANHVKSLRPPLRAPLRVPLALPCTPTLFPPSPLSPRRLLFCCRPFSFATNYAKNT